MLYKGITQGEWQTSALASKRRMESLHLVPRWSITVNKWNQGPFCANQIFTGETVRILP